VRRFFGTLVLTVLATPASLSLPSTRMANGESCPMACSHGDAKACCCADGGAGASFRRCPTPGDWFVRSPAMRSIMPAPADGPGAPPLAGLLVLLSAGLLLRVFSDRPDPVPKLLS
jgi:hypothetical protein